MMKRYILPFSVFLVLLLPNLLFSFREKKPGEELAEQTSEFVAAQVQQMIRVQDGDTVMEVALDDYVLGVLLGEMPADFESEALKAQAVATRTYTLRKVMKQNKHADAHVCTNAACCQAFQYEADYLLTKGTEENLEKMKQAVWGTSGQILTYGGEPIEATYFSCSGGRTEDAVAVWGTSVPYLQSVLSPGEEGARSFEQQFSYTKREFCEKLGLPDTLPIRDNSIEITYTDGGGVAAMTIGEYTLTGTQLRSALTLPSTALTFSFQNDTVLITARGNGHRVGMSQYGAEAMAVQGDSYDVILAHYYPGTTLETFTDDQMQAVFDKAGNL